MPIIEIRETKGRKEYVVVYKRQGKIIKRKFKTLREANACWKEITTQKQSKIGSKKNKKK